MLVTPRLTIICCWADPCIHKHNVLPSTYHQCLKAIWKGKKVHVNDSKLPFSAIQSSFLRGDLLWPICRRLESLSQLILEVCLRQHVRTLGSKNQALASVTSSTLKLVETWREETISLGGEKIKMADGWRVYILLRFPDSEHSLWSGPQEFECLQVRRLLL